MLLDSEWTVGRHSERNSKVMNAHYPMLQREHVTTAAQMLYEELSSATSLTFPLGKINSPTIYYIHNTVKHVSYHLAWSVQSSARFSCQVFFSILHSSLVSGPALGFLECTKTCNAFVVDGWTLDSESLLLFPASHFAPHAFNYMSWRSLWKSFQRRQGVWLILLMM